MATTNPVGQMNKALVGMFPGVLEAVGMNVYDSHPFLKKLNKNKKAWVGEAIRVKLVAAEYDKTQSYTGYDAFDTSAREVFTVGDFEMGGYTCPVTIDGMTMGKYRTAQKALFEMLGDEIKVAKSDFVKKFLTHFFATTNDAKGILSHYVLSDASTTIAGVAGSTTWGGTQTTSGAFATQGLNDMMTINDTLSQYQGTLDGSDTVDGPDMIVTTQSIRRSYWAELEPGMRYEPNGIGDVKLSLAFMGVPLSADMLVTSGMMHFINSNHMQLHVVPGRDFTPREDVVAIDQDAFSRTFLWNGQLVTNARRFQGTLVSIS
jgi:hypothetical protein